jgi:hypothetical protein
MLLFSLFPGSERCKFENYSFINPKTIIWVIYSWEVTKKKMGSFEDPSLVKKRWRGRLGILRVNIKMSESLSIREITMQYMYNVHWHLWGLAGNSDVQASVFRDGLEKGHSRSLWRQRTYLRVIKRHAVIRISNKVHDTAVNCHCSG